MKKPIPIPDRTLDVLGSPCWQCEKSCVSLFRCANGWQYSFAIWKLARCVALLLREWSCVLVLKKWRSWSLLLVLCLVTRSLLMGTQVRVVLNIMSRSPTEMFYIYYHIFSFYIYIVVLIQWSTVLWFYFVNAF